MPKRSRLNRRRFIKASAGAVAGGLCFPYIVSSSALGKDGRPAASERIVMGAIGVGSMGTGDLNGFLGKSEVQVVAVCDVDTNHTEPVSYTHLTLPTTPYV